jgi:chemotaxis protein CheZ
MPVTDKAISLARLFSTPMHNDDHKVRLLELAQSIFRFQRIGLIYEDTESGRLAAGYATVKQMTEQAANKVFSLIDQLQADAAALRALAQAPDAAAIQALADRQQAVSTELMMSQEFQDLSGQVINKVVKLLESVERPLHQVLAQAGDAATEALPLDSGELTGVQTPDKALQQDDVDDLLASLGF